MEFFTPPEEKKDDLDELIRKGQAGELGNPENPEGNKEKWNETADMENSENQRLDARERE